jgi:hypothetical protein
MKRAIIAITSTAALAVLFLFISSPATTAQGLSPQGGTIVGATTGGGLEKNASKLGLKTTCSPTQVLAWDGSAWNCATPSGGGGGGTVTSVGTAAPLSGGPITGTGTVSLTTCAGNQLYKMNGGGTAWACAADADTQYTAGTSMSLVGGAFSVNAPSPACSAGSFVSNWTGTLTGTCTAETGDISGLTSTSPMALGGTQGGSCASGSCAVALLAANTSRFFGRITAGAGNAEELTGTQATTLLDAFTTSLKGLVPASGGGTANFMRADGTWAVPPGTATGTVTGTGTSGTSTRWTGTSVIGNGALSDNGAQLGLGTAASATYLLAATKATASGGSVVRVTNSSGSTSVDNVLLDLGMGGGSAATNYAVKADGIIKTTSNIDGASYLKSGAAASVVSGCSSVGDVPTWSGSSWGCATPASGGPVPETTTTTGVINDYALGSTTTTLIAAGTGSTQFNGFTGGTDGRCIDIVNSLAGSSVTTLVNEQSGTTAVNRINTWAGVTSTVGQSSGVRACYELADARWRPQDDGLFGSITDSGSLTVSGTTSVTGTTTLNSAMSNPSTFSTSTTINAGGGAGVLNLGTAATGGITLGASTNALAIASPVTYNADQTRADNVKISTKSGGSISLSGCGTGATFSGDRTWATVTTGTSPGTCVITFGTAFTNVPTCIVSTDSATKTWTQTETTGSLTLGAVQASTKYHHNCVDHY